jgi:hypothetical protein
MAAVKEAVIKLKLKYEVFDNSGDKLYKLECEVAEITPFVQYLIDTKVAEIVA